MAAKTKHRFGLATVAPASDAAPWFPKSEAEVSHGMLPFPDLTSEPGGYRAYMLPWRLDLPGYDFLDALRYDPLYSGTSMREYIKRKIHEGKEYGYALIHLDETGLIVGVYERSGRPSPRGTGRKTSKKAPARTVETDPGKIAKLRDRLAKLREMREERGASTGEAETAARLAAEIEERLPPESRGPAYSSFRDFYEGFARGAEGRSGPSYYGDSPGRGKKARAKRRPPRSRVYEKSPKGVVEAFLAGEYNSTSGSLSTDGETIKSYAMPIARKHVEMFLAGSNPERIRAIRPGTSRRSAATSNHIRQVVYALQSLAGGRLDLFDGELPQP
mgnify:CR=1 FL=1